MLVLASILPFLALASAAHNPPHLRHRRLAHSIQQREEITPNGAKVARADAGHAEAHRVIKRTIVKKGQTCRPRHSQAPAAVASSASAVAAAPSPSSSTWSAPAPSSAAIQNQNAVAHQPTTQAAASSAWTAPAAKSSAQSGGGGGGGVLGIVGGLLSMNDAKCGWCNSDNDHPNGAQDWLNCGLNSGGWSPPHVTLNQLVTKELNPHGVFAPCTAYFDLFRQYGGEFGSKSALLLDLTSADAQFPLSCLPPSLCRSLPATPVQLVVVEKQV